MKTSTEELLKEIKTADNLQAFFDSHEKDFINFDAAGYLNDLLTVKNLAVSEVVKKSGVGVYLYKVFNGERTPSRNILISIALGMNLSLEETQLLLRISKFAVLDARDKRDSIIIYGITHGYDVFKLDDFLDDNNMITLN
ncbi:MAG: helix-turn-helix transcriptional regulator [Clostridia bacterium]|nr:helix-turn-helix transcriptional regulator [Clostridia bacterium]